MTKAPVFFSDTEIAILRALEGADSPMTGVDLRGATKLGEDSFKVILSRLRAKGFELKSPRGRGVAALYSLTDAERRRIHDENIIP